jgi:excisionase family DNA binding protein
MEMILHQTPIEDLRELIASTIRKEIAAIQKPEPEPTYISRNEAAEKLRITLSTLDKYTRTGILQAYRIGGRVRYRSTDLEKAFEAVKNQKYKRGV